ncbi:unnamed protein product [Urochloa humidicola]
MAAMDLQKSWKAEDVVHRLGLVMHGAFLHAGFVPYGPNPPYGHLFNQSSACVTSLYLSRQHTAPHLAHCKDADAVVLILCAAQEDGADDDIALVIFLMTDLDPWSSYHELLYAAAIARALDESTEPERF